MMCALLWGLGAIVWFAGLFTSWHLLTKLCDSIWGPRGMHAFYFCGAWIIVYIAFTGGLIAQFSDPLHRKECIESHYIGRTYVCYRYLCYSRPNEHQPWVNVPCEESP